MVDCPGPFRCFHCANQMQSRSGNSLLKWSKEREKELQISAEQECERKKDDRWPVEIWPMTPRKGTVIGRRQLPVSRYTNTWIDILCMFRSLTSEFTKHYGSVIVHLLFFLFFHYKKAWVVPLNGESYQPELSRTVCRLVVRIIASLCS